MASRAVFMCVGSRLKRLDLMKTPSIGYDDATDQSALLVGSGSPSAVVQRSVIIDHTIDLHIDPKYFAGRERPAGTPTPGKEAGQPTSDRTPGKETPTPLGQTTKKDGATSDRTPSNHTDTDKK